MLEVLSNPFVSGILSFILGALIVYVRSLFKQKELKNEIRKLKDSIVATMDEHRINSEKIKSLEEQINNQKVTIQILKEKPSQRELRELRIYAEACSMMTKKAPGFAQAWQNCVEEINAKEAEESIGRRIFTKPLQTLINVFKRPAAAITSETAPEPSGELQSKEVSPDQEK